MDETDDQITDEKLIWSLEGYQEHVQILADEMKDLGQSNPGRLEEILSTLYTHEQDLSGDLGDGSLEDTVEANQLLSQIIKLTQQLESDLGLDEESYDD